MRPGGHLVLGGQLVLPHRYQVTFLWPGNEAMGNNYCWGHVDMTQTACVLNEYKEYREQKDKKTENRFEVSVSR